MRTCPASPSRSIRAANSAAGVRPLGSAATSPSRPGRSRNTTASNLSARENSGGNLLMSFAVAIMNTGDVVSCIQVSKCPSIEAVVPASVSPLDFEPASDFSISSHHTTQAPNASMIEVASRIRLSDSPTSEFFNDPISSRISGQPRMDAVAFDDKDFPVPGIPTSSKPFG